MTQQIPIFVYGTLRANLGNYRWALANKTLSEVPATLTGAVMYDNNGGFPFVTMTDATPENTVVGDLMVINPDLYDAVINDLDGLEGYIAPGYPGNMYDRVLVTVTTADGQQVQAHTYLVAERLYQGRVRNLPVVESGDWVAHTPARPRPATSGYGW